MYEVTGILGAVTLDLSFVKAPLWEIALVGFSLGFDHFEFFGYTVKKKPKRKKKPEPFFFTSF